MIPTFPVSCQHTYPVLKLEWNTQNAVPVDTEKLKTALNICFMCTGTFTPQGGFPAETNQINLPSAVMPAHCMYFVFTSLMIAYAKVAFFHT
jgi:hypothetical protein